MADSFALTLGQYSSIAVVFQFLAERCPITCGRKSFEHKSLHFQCTSSAYQAASFGKEEE
jgi:hypothetical protein